ncbi:MAG: hypothetical protein E7044_07720 [Lentisphaerae bacterium]|nr:hypothetical protein [Lentisphaerota bacterium]
MTEKSLKSRQTGICQSKRNFSALYCSEIFTGQQCILSVFSTPYFEILFIWLFTACFEFFTPLRFYVQYHHRLHASVVISQIGTIDFSATSFELFAIDLTF